jgi:predicted Zn-dependent peptidase
MTARCVCAWLLLILLPLAPASAVRAQSAASGSSSFDRSVRPPAGPTPEFDLPDVERRTLSNGVELWLVPRQGIPMVSIRLLLDAGVSTEPPSRSGLASLTAAMLVEGTRTRTVMQIADELAYLAATLTAGAGQDSTAVAMTTLSRNLEPALQLLADVVINPSFPESEWPRVQDQRLDSLLQALDQPTTLANRAFARQVYGPGHPLGRSPDGTPAAVKGLTPETLREFHRWRYRPESAHLIAVGDFRPDRIAGILEKSFAGWKGPEGLAPGFGGSTSSSTPPQTRLVLVDKPGAAQSEIRIGHVGVTRNHPDYFPLLVMNTILGGQFSSRINLNLREDKGYTYGARSAFEMGRQAGPFVASGGVETSVTRESVVEFMRELQDIRSGRPVTAAEVKFAKTSLVRREPLTMETNTQIVGRLQDVVLYGLPADYYETFTRRIEEVTPDEVNRAAREHLQPERSVIVVVGDRKVVEKGLRELPYPVELMTAEEVTR